MKPKPSKQKTCGDPLCRRAGSLLPLDEFPKHRHRPDGRNNYCRECANRKTHECRERKRAKKKAEMVFKAAIALHQRPIILSAVHRAIANGKSTREQIQRSTRLDYDTLGEILVDLVWEVKSVKIERVGRERRFVAAA